MAGTYIHGGQPGFALTFNSIAECAAQFDLTVNRATVDARTNCGNSQTAGEVTTDYSWSGPLGFGAGSDEVTNWTHIIGTAANTLVFKPKNTTVGADNPTYTGSMLASQFKISAKPTGNVEYNFSGKETGTAGYPTRATA